jgi:hypothetical protein
VRALYLRGAGILAPGLRGWREARRVLAGEAAYRPEPAADPAADTLPPNERRRVARTVRWAMAAALDAAREAGVEAATQASVFASSSGDGETLHQICEALARDSREISPTRFHNSVHNAAAGYWSIASGARRTSVTVCAHDSTFAAGLLEAAALAHAGEASVLLVAYDLPYPEPLRAVRPVEEPIAAAVVLSAAPGAAHLAQWELALSGEPAEAPRVEGLAPSLTSNPASHALPLLAAAARRAQATVRIPHLGGSMLVQCRP